MQLEIDRLCRRLRRERGRRTPSGSDLSFDDDGDGSYKPRSRTPLSESFSYDEDRHYKWRSKSPSCKGLDNDAMSRALLNHRLHVELKGGKLPWRFTQPIFTIYNGRMDLVLERTLYSHFNQRMVVYS